jgi:hypothetical protein
MVDVRLGILFDYYGELLTDKQREFFEDYYFDNLTLQEIADNYEISRNAVHKTLNSIIKKLEYYEEKLKLYEKALKIKELIINIDDETKEKINDLI